MWMYEQTHTYIYTYMYIYIYICSNCEGHEGGVHSGIVFGVPFLGPEINVFFNFFGSKEQRVLLGQHAGDPRNLKTLPPSDGRENRPQRARNARPKRARNAPATEF